MNIMDSIKKEISTTPIATIRKAAKGESFVAEGIVTAGTVSGNAFFDTIYIQDSTGGIDIFPVSGMVIKVGQKVRVMGSVDEYEGDLELRVTKVDVTDTSINPVAPTVLTTKAAMDSANGGLLTKVIGTVTSVKISDGVISEIKLKDNSGVEARVFINGYIGYSDAQSAKLESFVKEGATITAIGLASVDPEGARLRVRDKSEIVIAAVPTPTPTPSDNSSDDSGSSSTTTSGSSPVVIAPKNDDDKVKDSVAVHKTPEIAAGTDNKVELKGDTVAKLIVSGKDLVVTSEKALVTLNNALLTELEAKTTKPLEVVLAKVDEKQSKAIKDQMDQLKNMALVGGTDSLLSLAVKSDIAVGQVNEPLTVSMSVNKEAVKDKSKLTAVRYEVQQDGSVKAVKVGGKYDEKSSKFIFDTNRPGVYGIVEASELLKVSLTLDSKRVEVNDKEKTNDVAPEEINGRTMVPVRFIAENLGAKVDWNDATEEVTIVVDGQVLSFKVGQEIPGFDVTPVIKNDRTLVPIRYITEKIGASVLWIPSTSKVEIVK
jgi:hypothetical protein